MIIPLQPKALAVAGSLGVIAFATFIDLFHPEPSLITLEKVIFCGIDNLGHSILAALLWLGITAMQLLQTGAGNTKSVHCSGFELLIYRNQESSSTGLWHLTIYIRTTQDALFHVTCQDIRRNIT